MDVNNYGDRVRDFTYIEDIIENSSRLIVKSPTGNPNWSGDNPYLSITRALYQLFNIGNTSPVQLMDFIEEIENQLGIEAEKNMRPMQPRDVKKTWADVEDLFEYIDYRPQIGIEEGIKKFINWYKKYYSIEV